MDKSLKLKFYGVIGIFLLSGYITICNILFISGNAFIAKLPFPKLNLGLDLVGGLHLSLEADIDSYFKNKYQEIAEILDQKHGIKSIKIDKNGIEARESGEEFEKTLKTIDHRLELDNGVVKYKNSAIEGIKTDIMESGISVIRNRIDSLGTKEIILYRESKNTIVLQIPNEKSSENIKNLISSAAKLSFHIVNKYNSYTMNPDSVVDKRFKAVEISDKRFENEKGKMYQIVEAKESVSGKDLSDARISFDNIHPAIAISFNAKGAKDFAKTTTTNTGHQLAIVIDDKVVSSPNINEPILSGRASISGSFTPEEMKNLVISLKSGALPAKFNIVEEKIIDAGMGSKSIKSSGIAMLSGLVLIFIFMVIFYKKLGLIAIFGLLVNGFLTVSVFSLFGITATLASIAGLLLTIAMAVDANILIYEKMKEFSPKILTPSSIINNGFKGAMSAIIDSNLTTIISAATLLIFGTVFVKGFAVSLIIGIIFSFFTAVSLTKIVAKYTVYKKYNLI